MALAHDELRRAAALARLSLSEAELASLAGQLSTILAHVEQLLSFDLDSEAESPGTPAAAPAGRADVPGADPLARAPAEFAPDWRDGYFTVPRVLAP